MLLCGRVGAAKNLEVFESLVIHCLHRVNCCQMFAHDSSFYRDDLPGVEF